MSSIWDWSTTAASNGNSDSGINWAENQTAASVNNSARAMMGRIAEVLDDIGGANTSSGSAGAYTLTSTAAITAYADGMVFGFRANHTNASTGTLTVNAIGAKAIYANGAVLVGGEIVSGGVYLVTYDSTLNSSAGGWHLLNPKATQIALTAASTITVNSSSPALTITQSGSGGPLKIVNTGSGNSLLIEDSSSTDTTPFLVNQNGYLVTGAEAAQVVTGGNFRLHVVSSSDWNAVFAHVAANATGPRTVYLKSRNGTYGSFTVVQSGDTVGDLSFAIDDGTDYASSVARIYVQVDGTPGSNDTPGRIIFAVTPDGSDTPVEAMRISNSGQVKFTASTTARAPVNVPAGTYVSSPANGDFGLDSSKFGFYVNGAWYSFTALLKTIADLSVVTGDLIYGSASDTASRLAIGTSNQALVVSGGLPAWTTLTTSMVSDAGLVYIGEWVYSSAVSAIDLTGLSAYREVLAVFDGVSLDGSDSIRLRTSADNGSSFASTGYESILATLVTAGNATITAGISVTRNGGAAQEYSGQVEITNLNRSTDKTDVTVNIRDRTTEIFVGGGRYTTARAEDAIRFTVSGSNNFDAGKIRFFGRK